MDKAILLPILTSVVLPIAVVLIVSLSRINGDNKRAQIIIKAIEANKDVDTDKLIESLKKPHKTARQILNSYLLYGCIFSLVGFFLLGISLVNPDGPILIFGGVMMAVGLSCLIVYFVTRKQLDGSHGM